MHIPVCVAKIHRATVTQADLNYVGSITVDEELLERSGIHPYQMVIVNNLSNGVSWRTYTISGERHSGVICLNGPPARHFQPGDKVIIMAEALIEPSEIGRLRPIVVFVDDQNRVTSVEEHSSIPSAASALST